MPYPLPLTRTEAYLAYKAGVIQQPDLKPSLAKPRIGIDDWLAYWTGLKNDYPKNPDGTPKMLQEEEKYIAYLCGVTDTYPDKCLRRVGAYLRYLISARWGRPDHPLNREELYLSLIKTQFIPSGDPSSDIVIDGTTKAPFVDVKMYGDTYQQSYTGKNLANPTPVPGGSNGVVATYNSQTGVVTVSGIAQTTWSNPFKVAGSVYLTAGTYTLKQYGELTNGRITCYARGGGYQVNASTLQTTFTTTSDGNAYICITGLTSGSPVSGTIKFQLESGSTATEFEPFVGGQPSPSPEYPQPIQTVTGEQVVTVVGKNLFDKDNPNIVRGYIAGTLFNAGTDYSVFMPCEENTTYTIQKMVAQPQTANRFRINSYDKIPAGGDSSISNLNFWNAGDGSDVTTHTYTTPAGAKYLGITVMTSNTSGTTTIDDMLASIQVEKGSATAYAPYSKQTLPLDLGTIELCRIDGYGGSTYRDSIYKNLTDNKWYLHKEVGKYVFNGSEAWTQSSRTTTVMYVGALNIVSLGITANESRNKSLANRAIIITTSVVGSFSIFNASSGVSQFMCYAVSSSYAASLAQFKEKLATDNLIVYAPLATPTDTAITDQNLINQLNALKQGGAENGTTYIKVNATDPNLPGLLYVEAPKYE